MAHVGVPCLSIGAFDYVDCVDEAIEVVSFLDDGFILIRVQVCWFLWWKQNKIAKHRTCHLFLVTTLLSNNWWQRNPRHPLRDLAALNSALPFTPPLSPVFSVNHQHVLFTASRQHQHQQHVITIKHDINHIHHHHYLHNSCPLFQENRQDESIIAPPYLGSLKTISTFSNDSIEGNIPFFIPEMVDVEKHRLYKSALKMVLRQKQQLNVQRTLFKVICDCYDH